MPLTAGAAAFRNRRVIYSFEKQARLPPWAAAAFAPILGLKFVRIS